MGRLGAAATLGQHCPQMTQRPGTRSEICIIYPTKKDLKTKNIFLENGHAIIADFGLVNVARRLCARHAVSAVQK